MWNNGNCWCCLCSFRQCEEMLAVLFVLFSFVLFWTPCWKKDCFKNETGTILLYKNMKSTMQFMECPFKKLLSLSPQRPSVCPLPSSWNLETTCSMCWQARSSQFWLPPCLSSSSISALHWTFSSRLLWFFLPSLSTMPADQKTYNTACSRQSCGSSTERCSRGPEG